MIGINCPEMNLMDALTSEPADTGGPAFPQHGWTSDPEVLRRMKKQGGMTLLDWFAGQALSALRSFFHATDSAITDNDAEHISETAYAIATAMLAEKRRREGGAA